MTTKVICPHCGGEIEIPANSFFTAGMSIGKDSNLGTVVLPPANSGKGKKASPQESRLAKLASKGVDVSNYVSLMDADGNEKIARIENGALAELSQLDLDVLERSIIENGYVKNTKLYRRWILAKLMRMVTDGRTIPSELKRLGYNYQWDVIFNELNTMMHLEKANDARCFSERAMFYTLDFMKYSCAQHLLHLVQFMEKCPPKKYYRYNEKTVRFGLRGKIIPVKDMDKEREKTFAVMRAMVEAKSYTELYKLVKPYRNTKLTHDTPLLPNFVKVYTEAGVYYGAKNLIMFHNCRIDGKDMYESLDELTLNALEFSRNHNDNGELAARFFLRLIEDNKFDFYKAMKEQYSK